MALTYTLSSPAAIANNVIVGGVAGKVIKVFYFAATASGGANTITFKSGSNVIHPAFILAANQTVTGGLGDRSIPIMQTAVGSNLTMAESAATTVDVLVVYIIT